VLSKWQRRKRWLEEVYRKCKAGILAKKENKGKRGGKHGLMPLTAHLHLLSTASGEPSLNAATGLLDS